jgi:protein-disulfide isomerase
MVKKMQVVGSRIRLFAQLALAGAIMAVLISLTGPSSSSEPLRHARNPHQLVKGVAIRRVDALFAGLPQHGAVLGKADAPVTLQFFGDLECPEARQFVLGALPFVIRRWVRSGDLRIVYRAYPAETIWSQIFNRQQAAALAAGEQGMLWQYLDFFYHEQGPEYTRYATEHFLAAIAEEVPRLGFTQWEAERDGREGAFLRQVSADRHLAHQYGIGETPAFMVGPTGGKAMHLWHFSLTEPSAFDEAVEGALASSARS